MDETLHCFAFRAASANSVMTAVAPLASRLLSFGLLYPLVTKNLWNLFFFGVMVFFPGMGNNNKFTFGRRNSLIIPNNKPNVFNNV